MSQIVWAAPLSFLIGVVIGLLASSRYRIVRKNGKPDG